MLKWFMMKRDTKVGFVSPPGLCASEVVRLHFGEVGPEADGHVLALLAGVEALADGEGAEVGAPEVLESLLVGGQEVGVEAGAEGGVVGQGDFTRGLEVVVVAVATAEVVDHPGLVSEAVGEVGDGQWERVVERSDGGDVEPVGGLAEADELLELVGLAADLEGEVAHLEDVRVGKVCGDRFGRVKGFADVAEEEFVDGGLLREPSAEDQGGGFGGELAHESEADAFGPGRVGDDGVCRVGKERRGFAHTQQTVGEGAAAIGVENGREEALEGFIVEENVHGEELKTKNERRLRVGVAFG